MHTTWCRVAKHDDEIKFARTRAIVGIVCRLVGIQTTASTQSVHNIHTRQASILSVVVVVVATQGAAKPTMPALAASSLSPLLLLLLHVAPGTASNLPGPSPPKGPYHPAALRSFISARCGGDVPPDRERGARQAASDGASSPTDSPPPPPPPPPPADAPTSAVWAYEGALVDPSNGHTVAQVEGIELCRHLSEVPGGSDPQLRRERGMRRMGDLRARDMLQQERQAWDFATTILSRRLFVYRAPSSKS